MGDTRAVGSDRHAGFSDIAVGVPDEDVGSTADAGAVNLLRGSSGGLVGTSTLLTQGGGGLSGTAEAGDRVGSTIE